MRLGAKQELFSALLPGLILKAFELGFAVRVGDLFRDKRVHGAYGVKEGYSSAHSMHKLKLAVDLNLMLDGALVSNTTAYKELGVWWEARHALCRWGGRFSESSPGAGDGRDGNHFSLTHDGRA